MRGILVGALIFVSSPAGAHTFAHVRSEQASVRAWLAEGYERSPTFRALVDEIDSLPGVVYIEATVAVPRGLNGALLHSVAGSPEQPLLRVLVRFSLSRDMAISTLGHELQHVAEVLRAGTTADASAMTALFASLDETHAIGSSHFETLDAQRVAVRVREELARNPRR